MNLRPRFSVRTLAIVVTLACGYFGAWEATKRYGVQSMKGLGAIRGEYWILTAHSSGPLVISCYAEHRSQGFTLAGSYQVFKTHYLWLFGFTIKLPFESLIDSPLYSADGDFLIPRT